MNRHRRPRWVNENPDRRARNIEKFSLHKLQNLLFSEPEEVTLSLTSDMKSFGKFLDRPMNYELTRVFLKLLGKSLQCTSLKEQTNQIISLIFKSQFPQMISQLILETDLSSEGIIEFLQILVSLLKTTLKNVPSEYPNTLPIIGVLSITLQEHGESGHNGFQDLQKSYEELQTLLHALTTKKRKQAEASSLTLEEESPPDDYRTFEIMPTAALLHSKEKVFLRQNKVKGAYDNVDHYLDVQFRLMHEDFFGPLRDSVQGILRFRRNNQQHIDDVYIYRQVRILYPICSQSNGICYQISFDASALRVNWERAKRLMYGSLVCLTPDNFESVYFGTITDRKVKDLKEGLVEVMFSAPPEDILKLVLKTTFTMIETTAYYEAYSHILSALKEINEDSMPFKDYIISTKSDVKAPKYLSDQRHIKMDLACLTKDCNLVYNSLNNTVKITSDVSSIPCDVLNNEWPNAEEMELNDSQFEALKNCLTKEFSLTQGPPGTGKTYVGLKIVKALCFNSNLWRRERKGPMLIVCYTNHALDQFLEKISLFLKGGILRVGARSTNEALSNYFLKNVREKYRSEKRFSNEFIQNKSAAYKRLSSLKFEIDQITTRIQRIKNGILHESELEDHMGQFYDWLVESFNDNWETNRKVCILTEWLGYGNIEVVDPAERVNEVEDNQNLPDDAEESDDDKVEMFTESDFIQRNRMVDDHVDMQDEFSALQINDADVIALSLDDINRKGAFGRDGFERTRAEKKRLREQLKRDLASDDLMGEDEMDNIQYHDLWLMSKTKRWQLYRNWVTSYCRELLNEVAQQQMRYNDVSKTYKELLLYQDGEIMKDALIVGMTTTAAAKYNAVLQDIKPKIIIVEEAAEILEAHIITALNPMCEQLVLIGDHKQLRPNPNVYELSRKYNLEISLFERIIMNNGHVQCLTLQHRMRPEISQLMQPIYSELHDHPSVMKYENVKGVAANMYFIQHDKPEKISKDINSYCNPHEASFIVELCKYLLKQGYDQSQITILTTYTAQLFQLKNLMKHSDFFKGLRLTVVDNYQGEENDIILLSLVRNNAENKIGFLKVNNRVCVALSRAKMGFYVIGNLEKFSEQSKLWKKLLFGLKSQQLIGTKLTLCCQNHPERKIQVKDKMDFSQTPEGGCLKPCESRLECGHRCKRTCHPVDDHDQYECFESCTKLAPGCPLGHKCNHICSMKCTPCMISVSKTMPGCNHQQLMACSVDPFNYFCESPCQKPLPCGHPCTEHCGVQCTRQCPVLVEKIYPCKHKVKSPCFKQSEICPHPCTKRLVCGHLCSSTCGQCSKRRIHSSCSSGCARLLVCGHQCKSKRCDECLPCLKPCQNRCVHSKCMKFCAEMCKPCKEPCEWRCEHYKCTKYCHESCDRPRCDQACPKRLRCGHPCVGLCGEKCPRLCRVCNKRELTEIFFGTEDEDDALFVELEDCSHVLEKSGLDEWMGQKTDGEVQLRFCPKCRVPIRRNLRYGQIINQTLTDIDQVKMQIIGNKQDIKTLVQQSETNLENLEKDFQHRLTKEWLDSQNGYSSLVYWQSFHHRIQFLAEVLEFKEKSADLPDLEQHCLDFCEWLVNHKENFSNLELKETEMETERIRKLIQFSEERRKLPDDSQPEIKRAKELIKQGLELLNSNDYSSVRDKVSDIQNTLSTILPSISEQERKIIVKAIGLPTGHWFKCPNGHFYVIGECGGAMERSKCPECGSNIGGSNHALESGNLLAREMDGAQYAAWSDQANMANYQF